MVSARCCKNAPRQNSARNLWKQLLSIASISIEIDASSMELAFRINFDNIFWPWKMMFSIRDFWKICILVATDPLLAIPTTYLATSPFNTYCYSLKAPIPPWVSRKKNAKKKATSLRFMDVDESGSVQRWQMTKHTSQSNKCLLSTFRSQVSNLTIRWNVCLMSGQIWRSFNGPGEGDLGQIEIQANVRAGLTFSEGLVWDVPFASRLVALLLSLQITSLSVCMCVCACVKNTLSSPQQDCQDSGQRKGGSTTTSEKEEEISRQARGLWGWYTQ